MKIMKKRILLSIAGIACLALATAVIVISCNKEDVKKDVAAPFPDEFAGDTVDFSIYYQEVEQLAIKFWAACDQAYNADRTQFLAVCESGDFQEFQRVTQLDADFFGHLKQLLLDAQARVEADHPGITARYAESPCTECSQDALMRIAKAEDRHAGAVSAQKAWFARRDCWFLCSLACMSTLELYAPCVLGCVELCLYFAD
jgi:hypothetical protein